jgi:hypothetical protein
MMFWLVIPAKAGIQPLPPSLQKARIDQEKARHWIPAFAGMTSTEGKALDYGFRRNDEHRR